MPYPRSDTLAAAMQTPYRSAEEPLAQYALRTHPAYYALLAFSALMLAPAALAFATFGAYALRSTHTYFALLVGTLGPVALWSSSRQLRVPDGAALKIHRDRIEFPGYGRGHVLSVPIGDVRVSLVRHGTRVVVVGFVPVGVDGGVSVTFAFPGGSRGLSHRVFGSVELAERAFADVLRVQEGLTPEGPAGRAPPEPTRTDDDYDRRIDEELRRMD